MEKVLRVEDGKYVTGEVIGAEVELMKLLWENPSPSSAFAAQTIALDLSEYDFIEISTYEGTPIYKARVGEGVNIQIHNRVTASGKLQYIIRGFNVTNPSGIVISDATVYTDSATAGTVVNGRIVPTKIYGIKNKIQTIANDVATTADKCIMSSGKSVEETVDGISSDLTEYKSIPINVAYNSTLQTYFGAYDYSDDSDLAGKTIVSALLSTSAQTIGAGSSVYLSTKYVCISGNNLQTATYMVTVGYR